MLDPELIHVLASAGVDLRKHPLTPTELEEINGLLRQSREDPNAVVAAVIRARRQARRAERNCARSTEAATKLEQIIKDLLEGNATLYRLEAVRRGPGEAKAVCRSGGQIREFSIHPEINVENLERLSPWEYVRVCENVAVGTWADDPSLLAAAEGEVVGFKGYHDREKGLVRATLNTHGETIVRLAKNLRDQEIALGWKLVLQRDDPGLAIAVIREQDAHSRFEVPIEQMETRLEDLAGIDTVARQLIEEVLVHVLNPKTCENFGLKPMKGFLLTSYKPGMGKTAFMRAFAYWLHELGEKQGFDVVLYFVPPNATKNLFHGEDARIVREDLWGAIKARRAQRRERALFQFVVLDEVDSLGKRSDANSAITSSAQSDALEAMLSEMDGLIQITPDDGPPAYTLVGGMTNLPERVDEALKRPGRLGDLDLEMPEIDLDAAVDIMAIHARGANVPWYLREEVRNDLEDRQVCANILRPALTSIFSRVVLHYWTEHQRRIDVTAGEILAGVHYEEAVKRAKKQAVLRLVRGIGVPAIGLDDVVENLAAVAQSTAHQMAADKKMLIRQLRVQMPVARIDVVPREELEDHRYLHVFTA